MGDFRFLCCHQTLQRVANGFDNFFVKVHDEDARLSNLSVLSAYGIHSVDSSYMTSEETLIDHYVTESGVMLARLGDHLLTLDELRVSHKHASLETFGLTKTASNSGTVTALLSSHTERYDVHMANYLRYAHVVLTYMIFEDRLHAFGRVIAATKGGPEFAPKSNRGLVPQFEKYLASLRLPIPPNGGIDALRQLRNCIVHARGCVQECRNAAELESLICRSDGVSVDTHGCLRFTTEACLRLQEAVVDYLHSVDSASGFAMWIPDEVRANFERNIAAHLRQTRDSH